MAAVPRMARVTAMAATAAAIRPTPTRAPRTGAAPIRARRSAGPIGAAIPVIGERAAPIGAAITATERIGGGHRQRRWPAAVPWLRWKALPFRSAIGGHRMVAPAAPNEGLRSRSLASKLPPYGREARR